MNTAKAKAATTAPRSAVSRSVALPLRKTRKTDVVPDVAPDVTPDATPDATLAIATPFPSKPAQLLHMLRAADGALLCALMQATGWQAHSIRSAMSGLRKAGHVILASGSADGTLYRLRAAAEKAVPQQSVRS